MGRNRHHGQNDADNAHNDADATSKLVVRIFVLSMNFEFSH